jgi:hypothetical protein
MSETTIGLINGNFKVNYADKIENLVADNNMWAQKNVKYIQKNGKSFNIPVLMSYFNGVTANDPAIDNSAYLLEEPQSAELPDAFVTSCDKTNTAAIATTAITRAKTSAQAFQETIGLVAGGLYVSTLKAQEMSFWYGRSPYATFSAQVPSLPSSTVLQLTLDLATFSEAIFKGAEKTRLQIFDVFANAYISLVGDVRIKTANLDAADPKLEITGSAVDITAIQSAMTAVGATSFQLYFYNDAITTTPGTYREGLGFFGAISSTTPYFGLDPMQYNLWKGNTFSAGNAPLEIEKVLKLLGKISAKASSSGGYRLHVNPNSYSDMISSQVDLRRYNDVTTTAKNGFLELKILGAVGEVTVSPNPFIMNGHGFIFKENALSRVGSSEVTFNPAGTGSVDMYEFGANGSVAPMMKGDQIMKGPQYIQQLSGRAGYELRCYADNTFFVSRPSDCAVITNIVPTLS